MQNLMYLCFFLLPHLIPLSSLYSSIRYLYIFRYLPKPSLLQTKQSTSLSFSFDRYSNSLIVLVALCSTCCNTLMSLLLGSPELDPALQLRFTSADPKGGITSLGLPAIHFLMQPRMILAFASRAHFWLFYGAGA